MVDNPKTALISKFAVGDRVTINAKGLGVGLCVNNPHRVGVVIGFGKFNPLAVTVQWDGARHPGSIGEDYIDKIAVPL